MIDLTSSGLLYFHYVFWYIRCDCRIGSATLSLRTCAGCTSTGRIVLVPWSHTVARQIEVVACEALRKEISEINVSDGLLARLPSLRRPRVVPRIIMST